LAEIRNPNLQPQGGGDGGSGGDMRGLMSITLLGLVLLFGYQYFFKPKQPATPAPAVQGQPPQNGDSGQMQPAAGQPRTPAGTVQAASNTPAVAASEVTQTTVENDFYKIVFTNQGAQVRHWILKKYNDTEGKPLDMVQPQASARFGLPLSLYTYEPALTSELNQALYQVAISGEATSMGVLKAPGSVTFHYAQNGIDAVKTLHFDSSYVITVENQVTRNGSPVRALLQWPAGLGDMDEFNPAKPRGGMIPASTSSQFAWSVNGKDDSIAAKKISGNATFELPYQYAAISDLYFTAAFLPDEPERTNVVTLHNSINLLSDPSDPNSQQKPADVIGLAVGDSSGQTRLRLYAGPKETNLLKSIHATGADGRANGPTLQPLIQYGFWTFIAKPLYLTLRFLHDHLGGGADDWGWSIIIFTTTFTVIMLPFRFMALKSSLKMMRIQPKVDAIKARFKNLKATDPKRADMNTEMMELYKVEGVNMYGSCLPMLPQIPLFFAYFRVLQNAVELRQAHWFWLSDLSSPDPKYILPILIILTMFLVQIKTPTPGMEPSQRLMMAFMMPVMMGFFLLHYASGLALYWGTSNIISLALQLGINQSHIGKEMHAIAAKRAAKKSGGSGPAGSIQKRK